MSTLFQGRSSRAVARQITNNLNRMLATTITTKPLILGALPGKAAHSISFRDHGRLSAASLRTRFGSVLFYVYLVYDIVETERGTFEVRTRSYEYHLSLEHAREPLFRWEYVSAASDPAALWCRHHIQGPLPTGLGGVPGILLNDFHLPTGPIAIEDVLRFCIVDLGVEPLSEGWDERLRAGAQAASA